ncbi:MAG: S9 family peptidase, partial [Bacteroidota bacterium]
ERAAKPRLTADNQYLIFEISHAQDSVKALRRAGKKQKDLPKDSIGIYALASRNLTKVADIKSYKVPEKWGGWLAYQKEIEPATMEADSTATDSTAQPLRKRKTKPTLQLIFRQLSTGVEDSIPNAQQYTYAKENSRFLLHSKGKGNSFQQGVYVYDCGSRNLQPLWRSKGTFKHLSMSDDGQQAAFVADLDTTDVRIRPFGLYHWNGRDSARLIAHNELAWVPENQLISEYKKPSFSKDGTRLFFGLSPKPIEEDTTLLPEEVVNVEVWSYLDNKLYTQQEVQAKRELSKSYLATVELSSQRFQVLGTPDIPNVQTGKEGNADIVLAYDESPYLRKTSWEGGPSHKDLYIIDLESGVKTQIAKNIRTSPQLSPNADYVSWYSFPDSAWYAHHIETRQTKQLTDNKLSVFFDELNDRPMHPYPYGIMGWLKDDEAVLIYDRYDIWKIDPQNPDEPKRLTNGRAEGITYRYMRLDREARFIDPNDPIILRQFDNKTKASGYVSLSLNTGQTESLIKDDYQFGRRIYKAKDANFIVFTKES